MNKLALLAAALVVWGATVTVPATTLTVTSTADSGIGSLREALAGASDGDTIDATGVSGTILLTGGELLVTNSVIILGPGPAKLAVDGNAASRVFHITPSNTVTIAGLTITNGEASESPPLNILAGDGIYNGYATLTVSNCTVSGGSASYLGGIFNHGSGSGSASLTIINSTLSGNNGGGIYNAGGYGGSATLRITNSTLAGNGTGSYGGGIVNDGQAGSANAVLVNCNVRDNLADSYGGAIFNEAYAGSATMLIINSTFSGNRGDTGGAIFNHGPFGNANLSIVNSTLSGNSAYTQGGGIFNNDGSLVLLNNTLNGNAALLGGGIYNHDAFGSTYIQIGSTILNAGASGKNIDGDVPYSEAFDSLGYNLSSDDGAGFLTNATDQTNTDPMLGPLQDNGGPTWTHALLPGSPAIDQGFNFCGSSTDQRDTGFVRTLDDPTEPNASGATARTSAHLRYKPQSTVTVTASPTQLINVQTPRRGPSWTRTDAVLTNWLRATGH